VRSLERCPHILALEIVAAKAASKARADVAVAADGVVREAVRAVDEGEPEGPHATLLALAPGFRGTLLKQRRPAVAGKLGVSADHLRDYREDGLLEAVADELYAADSAYRLRQRHRSEPERPPAASRVGINWLERHEAYRRVWTPVASLRDDLVVLLDFLRREAAWPDIADRLMNQLWRYAQFTRELERFIAGYGGLWLLADIDSEVAAASAIRRIDWEVPLGEADSSWLRLTLAETPSEELDAFIDRMLAAERGKELLDVWQDWAKSCACDLKAPDLEGCEVHRWMDACDQFVRLIDADWYRLADYYRTSEHDIHGIDVRELWERYRGDQSV